MPSVCPVRATHHAMTKRSIRPIACALFFLSAPLLAQTNLIRPKSAEDIRALSKQTEPAVCPPCGFVTNIQPAQRDPVAKHSAVTPEPGLETTAVYSSTTPRKQLRQERQPKMETYYKISVRFDDGTYAIYEQDDAPVVQKGDRVGLSDGKVVLRTP